MSKIAIVYWSGTGNTEAMANAVCTGAKRAGADVTLIQASQFDAASVPEWDAIGFGCPSMGSEELEDSEFAPMFDAAEPALNGKRIALFGSYGWGDGEWMRNWDERCRAAGAVMAADFVITNGEPDADAVAACEALGEALA